MNRKIAFVDDEINVLESIRWMFKDNSYDINTFLNPFEFLEKFEEENFAVVVADQVMPGIEGIQLLQQVKDRRPSTVCIIMTAHANIDIAINAMNQGNIFRFITKPWDVMEMKAAVKNAIDRYELETEIQRLWQITKRQNEQLQEMNKKLESKINEQTIEIIHNEEERKVLEAQLIESQKMEAIGTLAGGITHDFNNILSGIMGYTEVASLLVEEDPQVKGILNKILEAGERAKSLINQILSFSRHTEESQCPLEINPIVKEVIKLLKASLPPNIKIQEELECEHSLVEADPTRIHQILMNLCTNSAHAMREKGGLLKVCLERLELGPVEIASVHHNLESGSYLKLSVKDTGHGMTETTLKRIFDPYFTTKEKGEGTGLGLAVVQGIVKNYKGSIEVESAPDKGTTFSVYLPCLEITERII